MGTITAPTASLFGCNVRHRIPRHRQSRQYVFENAQRRQRPPQMKQLLRLKLLFLHPGVLFHLAAQENQRAAAGELAEDP